MRIKIFAFFILTIFIFSNVSLSWARDISETEAKTIQEIIGKGPGNRFVIKDIIPSQGNVTVEVISSARRGAMRKILLYEDGIQKSNVGFSVMGPSGNLERSSIDLTLLEEGDIIRFKGRTRLSGYTFYGNSANNLSFVFLKKGGIVYLGGEGKVLLKDGKTVNLP
jgi:hypothetical protein